MPNLSIISVLQPDEPDDAKTLARLFTGVRAPTVQRLVDALAALGQVG